MNTSARLSKHLAFSRPAPAPARSTLQRACACGQHTLAGGECAACRQKRESALQRATGKGATREIPGRDSSRAPLQENHPALQQAAKVPGAPVNEFEDCPAAWQKEANDALVLGRGWVANVINGLSSLPNPIPAPVAALLNRHFHTTNPGDIRQIVKHFNTISAAMNAKINFECETSCDKGVAAYVYSVWTDVHLCPVWHALPADQQADTIIHELAHDAAGRDDEAYLWQPKYATLSVEDAIDNADSYSSFAREAS